MTNLLESLRIELLPHHVAVTTIEPGFVRTDMTAQNDFSMPFILEPDQAARLIHRAVLRRRRVYTFPWRLKLLMKASNLLPLAIYDRVLAHFALRKPAASRDELA
jgi:short-subunit dehydrogenase